MVPRSLPSDDEVAMAYAEDFEKMGGSISVNKEVSGFASLAGDNLDFTHGVRVQFADGSATVCAHTIVCAGAYADR